MNTKRIVYILLVVVFLSLGLGIFSLKHNDNFSWETGNGKTYSPSLNVKDQVSIGRDGIRIVDGDNQVTIDKMGIRVIDGDNSVDLGWDGIRVKEGNKYRLKMDKGWPWSRTKAKDLREEDIRVEESFTMDGVNLIDISSPFVDIRLRETEEKELRVYYHGSARTNKKLKHKFEKNSRGTLNLQVLTEDHLYYIVEDSSLLLEVFLPQAYKGDIVISSNSGDMDLAGIEAGKLDIMSTSGDIDLKGLDIKDLIVTTTSADIRMENIQANSSDLITTSGDIGVGNTGGRMLISTVSGDVNYEASAASGNLDFQSISGDIYFKLDRQANYRIEGSTTSGNFKSQLDMKLVEKDSYSFQATLGNGDGLIQVNTVSGDMYFK